MPGITEAPVHGAAATPGSVSRRLAAMIYDSMLILAIWMLGTAALLPITGGEAIEGPWMPLYQLYLLALTFTFFAGFWLRGGQTLGMKAWRLHVERNDGQPLALKDAVRRFVAAIPALLPFGLGLFWCLIDRDRLAWHDRLSQTRIVFRPDRR